MKIKSEYHCAFFERQKEAEKFADNLKNIYKEIGFISRNDFRKLLGFDGFPVGEKIGWNSIEELQIVYGKYHGKNGWKVILPKAQKLNL